VAASHKTAEVITDASAFCGRTFVYTRVLNHPKIFALEYHRLHGGGGFRHRWTAHHQPASSSAV